MSKLSDRRTRHDAYHKKAKGAGYRGRAVFKLEEIDDKLSLIRRDARILDLGCAPGSWLQLCRERGGRGAVLVGVDRAPLSPELPGVRVLVGDIHELDPSEILGELEAFDLVLSDMAPDTSGVRHVDQLRSEALFERALEIACATLARGGAFVGKLFQGPAFPDLIKQCRAQFETVKIVKPKGSRTASIEQYITGRGYAGRAL